MYRRNRYGRGFPSSKERQTGAIALVVGMILFFGATLITVYTLNPVRTEQRVAANEYRSFQALNAAEGGLAHAQEYFRTFGSAADASLCVPNTLLPDNDSRGSYQILRINGQDCDELDLNDAVSAYGYTTLQLEVEGWSDDGSASRILSQSVYIMNFGDGSAGSGSAGGFGPMNFAGDVTFNAPTSGAFQVDGGGGPAVSVQDSSNKAKVEAAIEGNANNYIGGIGEGFGNSLWDSPDALNQFVNAIKNSDGVGNGSLPLSGINVVDGDFHLQGNDGGDGVLVVKGDFSTTGTPNFNGLIIVLGGTYSLTGGGSGGQGGGKGGPGGSSSGDLPPGGSIFVANLQESSDGYRYGDTAFENKGGGNAGFNYNFDALVAARNLLSQEARDLWQLSENESVPDFTDLINDEVYQDKLRTGIISGSWVDFQ